MFLAYIDEFGDTSPKTPLSDYRNVHGYSPKLIIYGAFICQESEEEQVNELHKKVINSLAHTPEGNCIHWSKDARSPKNKYGVINCLALSNFHFTYVLIDKTIAHELFMEGGGLSDAKENIGKDPLFRTTFGHLVSEIALACKVIAKENNISDTSFKIIVSDEKKEPIYQETFDQLNSGSLFPKLLFLNSELDLLPGPIELIYPQKSNFTILSSEKICKTPGLQIADCCVGGISQYFCPTSEAAKDKNYLTRIKKRFPNPYIHNGVRYNLGLRIIGLKGTPYYLKTMSSISNTLKMRQQRKQIDIEKAQCIFKNYCIYQ